MKSRLRSILLSSSLRSWRIGHKLTMRPSTQQRGRGRSPMATAAIPTILLSLSALLPSALANPYPRDGLHNTLSYGFLQDRSCAIYCGAENEHCCSEDQRCTTVGNVAGCAGAGLPTLAPRNPDDGSWSVYTSTWTETETFTSTFSSYWGETTGVGAGGGTCTPVEGSGEIACGSICCASWQYCASSDQCVSNAGATAPSTTAATTAWSTYSTTMTTAGSTITTQFSAPYRVTGTASTGTNTGTVESATTTSSGNGTAVSTTSGSTLSGGAIAGIVIGTLAGVGLLLLLCFCCVMRGLWHGLLALLGLGPKKRERSRERETVIIEEERYARHGSQHGRRDTHGSWFAARPARSTAAESRRTSEKPPRRDSNQASWWGAGALGTLLLLLGLRRDKKRRSQSTAAAKRNSRRSARSEVSSSYFSDSYTASSPSEFSSDYTYASVYTPAPAPAPARSSSHGPSRHPGGPRSASVARSQSVRSASRYRDERDYSVVEPPRDYDFPPKSNLPPDYAGSASSGGRTRDTRRSRRTEGTRISRAQSRR